MINTDVKIWYGWQIDATNCYLDYRYASDTGPRLATLRFGRYTSTTLSVEIKRALLDVGVTPINVVFDRTLKKFILSSSVVFTIASNTGSKVGTGGGWTYLGFSQASDKFGQMTYTADTTCLPYSYSPQFKLQSLTSPGYASKLRDPVISESSSGEVELTHYGVIQPVEFEILFITNINQLAGSAIRNNPTGVEDANRLLSWATKKGLVEFIPDSTAPATSYDLILETTDTSTIGTDYKLSEEYARGLPNIYKSGLLKWRVYG